MRKPDIDPGVLSALLTRILGPGADAERTAGGTSTQVYRIRRCGEVFYLRIAENADYDLAVEAELHRVLCAQGVRVPEVVHFEPHVEVLDRSIMVMREIPGRPVEASDPAAQIAAVYRAAGRDLALVNSVAVIGFDWVVRDGSPWPIRGQRQTYADFIDNGGALKCLPSSGFSAAETEGVGAMLDRETRSGPVGSAAVLSHADLDLPHVFAVNGGYTGLIDFGEIRGTDRWYDIAEFALHSDDPTSALALKHLVAGYADVVALPADFEQRVHDMAAMVVVHRLSRWLRLTGPAAREGWFFGWNERRLHDLLDGVRLLP